MEDHILSAAMKLSHGEDLKTTICCLHDGIKASEDALTRDLEAFNWFDLSIPTDLLNCQPSQSLPAAEINYSSLLPSEFQNPAGPQNAAGIASPPYTPEGFPSTSAIHPPPCINPQLLEFGQLRLNEDAPIVGDGPHGGNGNSARQACEVESDGRNGEMGGKNGEDGDAAGVKESQEDNMEEHCEEKGQENGEDMGVKEPPEDKMEEDHEEKGQENGGDKDTMGGKEAREDEMEEDDKVEEDDEDESQEELEDVAPVDFHSDLSSEEEEKQEEEEEEDEEEQDKKQKDAAESDPEESDAVEEDTVGEDPEESDAAGEDSAEEDSVEEDEESRENGEDAEQVDLRRSARLQNQSGNPPSYHEPLAATRQQPGRNAIKSKPSRIRANLLEVVSVSFN